MKTPEAFRGISEVADAIGVRQHTLRAWETRFPFVAPVKRTDGRRYYRPSDIALLRELKRLIVDERRSVEEILKINRGGGLMVVTEPLKPRHSTPCQPGRAARLRSGLDDLIAAKDRLLAALGPSTAAAD